MDRPDGVPRGKPDFDTRDFGGLVGRSVVGVWPSIPFLDSLLRIGGLHWPALFLEADS